MNGKCAPYVIGGLVGAVAVLGLLQAMDHRKAAVYAQDTANATSSFALGIASTEQNRQDLIVVVYKRPNEGGDPTKDLRGGERITMAFYKPPPGNVNEPKIQLQSVREITWDLQLMKHNNEGVKLEDVLETLKKQKKAP